LAKKNNKLIEGEGEYTLKGLNRALVGGGGDDSEGLMIVVGG